MSDRDLDRNISELEAMSLSRRRGRWLALCWSCALGCTGGGGSSAASAEEAAVEQIVHDGAKVSVPERSPLRGRLKIEPARTKAVTEVLQVPAQVETDPTTTAKITPPVAGRVVALFVHVGDTVTQGQPLLTLDAPDLVTAQSDYLRAQSTVAQAEKTRSRQQDLKAHGVGSEKDLEQAQTDARLAREDLERASMRLKLLKTDPGQLGKPLTVFAPIPGRIVDAAVAPGELKNDPNVVLMTIADLSRVWLTANVQEKDVRKVKVGEAASATLTAYPGQVLEGRVRSVADVLDPDTRTLKARISIPNEGAQLKPGMFALVTFHGHPIEAVVVPATALVLLGDKTVVFQELAPWTFAPREVVPGTTHDQDVVIVKGLTGGERIVTANAVMLQ
ncbi:MAG TPA: efflux RND transporter periplasmic adaptor subunit [Kofleriaceae bacterium]|nr:efflux RND transporter periplasmic adaptor subunit [Kofleriaceae bacterium]